MLKDRRSLGREYISSRMQNERRFAALFSTTWSLAASEAEPLPIPTEKKWTFSRGSFALLDRG